MLGYEQKSLSISHDSSENIQFIVEVDFLGTGEFVEYLAIDVEPRREFTHEFDQGFSAHWLRLISKTDTTATAQLSYK